MIYHYLKLIHLLAVVIFLGNIITGLFWMRMAMRTNKPGLIHFTMHGVRKADKYFTIPGVVIITAFGIWGAITAHYPLLGTGWILYSIILFSISGIVFSVRLAPLQKKIHTITREKDTMTTEEWKVLQRAYREWDIWGLIATLTPLAAFAMMVLKRPV